MSDINRLIQRWQAGDQRAAEAIYNQLEQWKFETGDIIYAAPTVSAGAVYFGSGDSHLYALDSQTGQELWNFKAGPLGVEISAPIIAGEAVYFWSNKTKLYALDSQTGQELWQFDLTGKADSVNTVPTINNGIIYFGDDGSYLNAVR